MARIRFCLLPTLGCVTCRKPCATVHSPPENDHEKNMTPTKSSLLRRSATFALLLFLGMARAMAQDSPQVQQIREMYIEVNEGVAKCGNTEENEGFCEYYLNTVNVNHFGKAWPAVGIYQSTQDFWGQMVELGDGPEMILRKVKILTTRSNRHETEEFLFDTGGELCFYFFKLEHDAAVGQELRFYFTNGKLVDYKEKIAPDEKEYQQYKRADFTVVKASAEKLVAAYQASIR
jgi:hypothetical protein